MTGYEYERECAKLLKAKGFTKVSVTPGSGDQGIDILAHKGKKKYGIQCKYYESTVGNKAVQEAYAGASFYNCDIAMVITNSTLTKPAEELAKKLGVLVWENIDAIYLQENDAEYMRKKREAGQQEAQHLQQCKRAKEDQDRQEFEEWKSKCLAAECAHRERVQGLIEEAKRRYKGKEEYATKEFDAKKAELEAQLCELEGKREKSRSATSGLLYIVQRLQADSRFKKAQEKIVLEQALAERTHEQKMGQIHDELNAELQNFQLQESEKPPLPPKPPIVQELERELNLAAIRKASKSATSVARDGVYRTGLILLALYQALSDDRGVTLEELQCDMPEVDINTVIRSMWNDGNVLRQKIAYVDCFKLSAQAYTHPNTAELLSQFAKNEASLLQFNGSDLSPFFAQCEEERQEELASQQIIQNSLKEVILEILGGSYAGMTISEIRSSNSTLQLHNTELIAKLVWQLEKSGRVVTKEVKGRTLFQLR